MASSTAERLRPLRRFLFRSEDGGASPLATSLALLADRRRLVALFRSEYRVLTPVGHHHDDDLFAGDVVELFVAPDDADRRRYFEIEANPAGLLFDARVDSPDLDRKTMTVDRGWNPSGLRVRQRLVPPASGRPGLWLVRIALDWSELGFESPPRSPLAVAAYRVDRRSTPSPLFLSLAPNHERPANFHVPRAFVRWQLLGGRCGVTGRFL